MAYKQTPNIGYEKFKEELRQKSLGNFYIFTGEEAYLRAYYLEMLKKQLLDEATAAFNYHYFSSETLTPEALADSKEALPMMAERSLIVVDDVDFYKQGETERDKYTEIFSDIPPYCTLVLLYETTEFKQDKRIKKLTQALERATLVEFRRQNERELAAWIARHFRSEQKSISSQLCSYLIRITDGLMTTLQSEIAKISAYSEGSEITKADIDAVVEPVLDAVVFDLSDAIAGGNYELALKKTRTLKQMQLEPINILGSISSQVRRILTAKTLSAAGQSKADLMKLCGIADYPAQKTMEYARQLSDGFCERAALLCLETDYHMKTSFDETDRLLELLVLQLAQEARNA